MPWTLEAKTTSTTDEWSKSSTTTMWASEHAWSAASAAKSRNGGFAREDASSRSDFGFFSKMFNDRTTVDACGVSVQLSFKSASSRNDFSLKAATTSRLKAAIARASSESAYVFVSVSRGHSLNLLPTFASSNTTIAR